MKPESDINNFLRESYIKHLKKFKEHTQFSIFLELKSDFRLSSLEAIEIYNDWIESNYVEINELSSLASLGRKKEE